MAELTNRDDLEAEFARRMAKLSAAHRRELIQLLGSPPRYENVPAEFWSKVESDTRYALAAVLIIIFTDSMRQHGYEGPVAAITAQGWATQRAGEVAAQWTQTSREIVQDASQEWNRPAPEKPLIPIIRRDSETGKPIAEPEPEASPAPPTQADIREASLEVFGPDRVGRLAENETTAARHEGSEVAVESTVGLSDDDLWINTGSNVCPVCSDLNLKPRSYWARFFPGGPPDPHVSCKCYIQYAN